jgi:hypothetical protein
MANDHLHQWPLIGVSGAPPAEQGTPHVRIEDDGDALNAWRYFR